MEEKLVSILNEMSECLSIPQMRKLQEVLLKHLSDNAMSKEKISNNQYLQMFLEAKRIEGCSERTLQYYRTTVEKMFNCISDPIRKISTEDIRTYLSDYQKNNNCSKVTVDNVRRNISSFFAWLEEEDHILKSPMRRIHKIKTKQPVKEIITDEAIEKLRDGCTCTRDIAMIDLLYSTGMRVGELVKLNISDINFEERECIVFGKGDKERQVYFDAKAKLHLQTYINEREDDNPALFVTLDSPHDRLKISGVEIRLRNLGKELSLNRIHPHKFRRTMATRAIDKGMPIEQVQKILGHSQIDTTMQYAIVNQNNVKTYQINLFLSGNNETKVITLTHDLQTAFDIEKVYFEITDKFGISSGNRSKHIKIQELRNNELIKFEAGRRNEYSRLMVETYLFAIGANPEYDLLVGNSMRRIMEAFGTFMYKKGIENLSTSPEIKELLGVPFSEHFENLMYRLVLHGGSHNAERVRGMDSEDFFDYISEDEKKRTAQEILTFLYILDSRHVLEHLKMDSSGNELLGVENNLKQWKNNIKDLHDEKSIEVEE